VNRTPEGGELAPLPQTRIEADGIAALVPSDRRTVLLGADAREGTVSAPDFLGRFRLLHFATHGLVDERRPERSSLALSFPADPSEDGYLQAAEIYRLRLQADLVTLSACETGLGRMVRGEGVLGLPRAFFFAGTPRVIVSLWSVSDRSTADLMVGLYRQLLQEGAAPAVALGRAKRTLREGVEFAHPFYWAPFVLMGPR
jgi:CHAT domain-containing protein